MGYKIWHKSTYLWNEKEQTHRYTEQTCGFQGGGGKREGRNGSVGLVDASYSIWDEKQQGPTV